MIFQDEKNMLALFYDKNISGSIILFLIGVLLV